MLDIKIIQNIVEEIAGIVSEDINFMNEEGVIIASTDHSRLHQVHGGALSVIQDQAPLIVHEEDTYESTKAGINLPVFLEGRIVGVIGLTGDDETVWKYGSIIQKMTEILMKEHLLSKTKQMKYERLMQFFIRIFTSNEVLTQAQLKKQLSYLNLVEMKERRVVLIEPKSLSFFSKYHTPHLKSCVSFQYNHFLVCIIHDSAKDQLIEELKNTFNKEDVMIGIGRVYENILDLRLSYQEALMALSPITSINFYEDMDIELLLKVLPNDVSKRFHDKVFGLLDSDVLDEFSELIEVFIKENGSITSTAKLLYIHKNTCQYRLNKLAKATGYNPRVTKDLLVLYMALLIRKSKTLS